MALLGGAIGVLFGIAFAKVVTLAIGMPSEIKLWAVLRGSLRGGERGHFFRRVSRETRGGAGPNRGVTV